MARPLGVCSGSSDCRFEGADCFGFVEGGAVHFGCDGVAEEFWWKIYKDVHAG